MKISDMENKMEALENDLFIIYQTANALYVILNKSSITVEQAEDVLRIIMDNVADSIKNVKYLVEETATARRILESI